MVTKHVAVIGTVGSILFAALAASAQEPASTPAPASATVAPRTAPPPTLTGDTDHDGVVGHFGATLFPTQAIPFPVAGVAVNAPVIGVRYWLMPNLGIDGGIGLGWNTGSGPAPFAMAFHGGVPFALASSKHFTFLVIPEVNLAFAHENIPVPLMANNTADGFLFDMGARVGAEIQFGFIGIPQLSLQGSFGLLFTHAETNTNTAGAMVNFHANNLTTTVGSTPWAIFTNAVSATYYL
jgi:hypothetical protein